MASVDLLFRILFSLLFLLLSSAAGYRSPISVVIVVHGNITGRFNTNVRQLLADLVSNSSTSLYHNATVGGSTADAVYGLYSCSGDASGPACRSCVVDAADFLYHEDVEGTYSWFDGCFLRYSNINFFGDLDGPFSSSSRQCGEGKSSEAEDARIVGLLTKVAADAAGRAAMFASANDTTMHAAAQCTWDLGAVLCRSCLENGVDVVKDGCKGKRGGSFFSSGCSVRFSDSAMATSAAAAAWGTTTLAVAVEFLFLSLALL